MNILNENRKVQILMGLYFPLNCLALSYTIFYLGAFGIQDSTIGIAVAIAAVIGFVLQGMLGRFIDNHLKWYWRNVLIILGIFELIVSSLILACQLYNADVSVMVFLYCLFIITTIAMAPLVNTSSFYYTAHGRYVNFGVARGIGSLSFALISYIIGFYAAQFGIIFIPACGIVFSILFLLSVIVLPDLGPTNINKNDEKFSMGLIEFIRRNKSFLIMALGICLVFIFHNMINQYLIRMVENVGGGSDALGLALSIAAICELPVLFLYDRFVKRYHVDTRFLIFIGCLFFAIRGVLYIFATDMIVIFAIQTLQSLSFALLVVSKTHFADEGVGEEDKATGQAIMSMTEFIGMVFGSAVGGLTISFGGVYMMYISGISFAALGSLIVLVIYLKNYRNSSKNIS